MSMHHTEKKKAIKISGVTRMSWYCISANMTFVIPKRVMLAAHDYRTGIIQSPSAADTNPNMILPVICVLLVFASVRDIPSQTGVDAFRYKNLCLPCQRVYILILNIHFISTGYWFLCIHFQLHIIYPQIVNHNHQCALVYSLQRMQSLYGEIDSYCRQSN